MWKFLTWNFDQAQKDTKLHNFFTVKTTRDSFNWQGNLIYNFDKENIYISS